MSPNDLISTVAGPAIGYLEKLRNRNDGALESANAAIFEDLVVELQEQVRAQSERLNEQGRKLQDLSEKQQRAIVSDYVDASRKTSSPAKQRAYTLLAARFWLPGEDIDVLPFWWNRLVDLDPAVWAAMLQLKDRMVLVGDGVRVAAYNEHEFAERRRSMRTEVQRLARSNPESAKSLTRSLIEGVTFEDAPELRRYTYIWFAHHEPVESDNEEYSQNIRSAKLPGKRLFWLSRKGRLLVKLASD